MYLRSLVSTRASNEAARLLFSLGLHHLSLAALGSLALSFR